MVVLRPGLACLECGASLTRLANRARKKTSTPVVRLFRLMSP